MSKLRTASAVRVTARAGADPQLPQNSGVMNQVILHEG
jgi:hypothetical protein